MEPASVLTFAGMEQHLLIQDADGGLIALEDIISSFQIMFTNCSWSAHDG